MLGYEEYEGLQVQYWLKVFKGPRGPCKRDPNERPGKRSTVGTKGPEPVVVKF